MGPIHPMTKVTGFPANLIKFIMHLSYQWTILKVNNW